MLSTFQCSGCQKVTARRSDLVQHFKRASLSNPKCRQAYQEYETSLQSLVQNRTLERHPVNDIDTEMQDGTANDSEAGFFTPEAPIFNGDFFGDNYSAADFPGFTDDIPDLFTEDCSDEEDEEDLETYWEADRIVPAQAAVPSCTGSGEDRENVQPPSNYSSSETAPIPSLHLHPGSDAQRSAQIAAGSQSSPRVKVVHFGGQAGARLVEPRNSSAFEGYQETLSADDEENPFAPFVSQLDWEIAKWAKMRGPSSTAFTELLAIDGVATELGLSYRNTNELNKIIDQLPSQRPIFKREEVIVQGVAYDLFRRDILECVRALFGDPEHANYLVITPERHYADEDETIRLYHDFHTGKWWWATQKAFEQQKPGATVIPIILSSDKTQVTLFRNKTAYPIYLTIGNLPKEVRRKPSRRGQILLAYLPTTTLKNITNKAARRRIIANLFHVCMTQVVEKLKDAGINGIAMKSGDGITRRCHPILAAYVGDYPEQVLVTCTYSGDCPICDCPHDELGDFPCVYPGRDFDMAVDVAGLVGTEEWVGACLDANIKPIQHPFWEQLPYVDIFRAITPDILHQLLQGVLKHLIAWITTIIGSNEMDARVRRLPPSHGIRIFRAGITSLSRVTGAEHKQICSFLLGTVIDAHLPDGLTPTRLITATRALLDFLYKARFEIHSDATLDSMDADLKTFHDNKHIFVDLGVRTDFKIPKLHALSHYTARMRLYGTADNYNTETTERLHIDFAKEAYRATNHKDEFQQMTVWLARREKVLFHARYINWRLEQHTMSTDIDLSTNPTNSTFVSTPQSLLSAATCTYEPKFTQKPTLSKVRIEDIASEDGYNAKLFEDAFARFVARLRYPELSARQLEARIPDIVTPFLTLPVYHRMKLVNHELHGREVLDSVHAHPALYGKDGKLVKHARFDPVLIRTSLEPSEQSSSNPFQDRRIARIRVLFSIPPLYWSRIVPSSVASAESPGHFAYVEWYTKFPATSPSNPLKLHHIKKDIRNGQPLVSIVPASLIEHSVHLFPKWGPQVPVTWTSENVLDMASSFYVSVYRDPVTFRKYLYM